MLLFGSSHDKVPGNEVGVELLGVLQRLQRLGAVDDHLVVLVDQLAAEGPDQPVGPGAVAGRVAQRHAARRALLLQRLVELEEVLVVGRELVEAGRLDHALAVDDERARGPERQPDPLLAVGPHEELARGVPAAVFLAQVFRQVGDVEQLVRIEVGVVVGRQDDVRPGAGVGRHRSLGPHVFPALVVDPHLDAGGLAEALDVGHVGVDVALHEAAPAQHPQLGALLGLEGQGLRIRERREDRGADAERGCGREAGRTLQNLAAIEITHSCLLLLNGRKAEAQATSLWPVAASKRWAR